MLSVVVGSAMLLSPAQLSASWGLGVARLTVDGASGDESVGGDAVAQSGESALGAGCPRPVEGDMVCAVVHVHAAPRAAGPAAPIDDGLDPLTEFLAGAGYCDAVAWSDGDEALDGLEEDDPDGDGDAEDVGDADAATDGNLDDAGPTDVRHGESPSDGPVDGAEDAPGSAAAFAEGGPVPTQPGCLSADVPLDLSDVPDDDRTMIENLLSTSHGGPYTIAGSAAGPAVP